MGQRACGSLAHAKSGSMSASPMTNTPQHVNIGFTPDWRLKSIITWQWQKTVKPLRYLNFFCPCSFFPYRTWRLLVHQVSALEIDIISTSLTDRISESLHAPFPEKICLTSKLYKAD